VAAVLGDALHRVTVLGGREGMPRSLGSVYGGSVTRFLGGGLRGVVSRIIATPGKLPVGGVSVSVDGSSLLVADTLGPYRTIHEFSIDDGSQRRVVGGCSSALWLVSPGQVCIAPDGFVFVADVGLSRVLVLTPELTRFGTVGDDHLTEPLGVCANADVVVVSEQGAHRISVFNRVDGSLRTRFGCEGSGDGQLSRPGGLCFVHGDRHIAVADCFNHRVSVFSVDGEFVRHVGEGTLRHPQSVACSVFDELVVADAGDCCIRVFGDVCDAGDVAMTVKAGRCRAVAVHGCTVYAHDCDRQRCLVFR
jgi:DNA-binding beta-propeller fold protein YncE